VTSATRRAAAPNVHDFDPKPQSSLGHVMRETSRELDREITRGLMAFGLTISQYNLACELWAENGLNVRELAARVSVAEPSTLMTLCKMQENGFLTMRVGDTDRRKVCVFLEPKGIRLRKPVLALVARIREFAYGNIDRSDLQATMRVFAAIRANLELRKRKRSPKKQLTLAR
jgi:MarR family transcriptional regulator, organic hydroperoxide resistance regulator